MLALSKSITIRVFTIFSLFALSATCSNDPSSETQDTSTPNETSSITNNATAPAETSQTPIEPIPDQLPDVLALVNGEEIHLSEFEEALKGIEERAGAPAPTDRRDEIYRNIINQLIEYRLLVQETVERNIVVSDQEVEARLAVFKQHFGSSEDFEKALSEQKLTLQKFKEETRITIRLDKMLSEEVEAKISIESNDLENFYKENLSQFSQEEQIEASHILIVVAADAKPWEKEAARKQAAGILEQIRAGQDFASLAREHSQDPGNAQEGGEIGYFGRGAMVGAFERAAFALKPGEVSELVDSPFGFHIIKVTDKQPSRTLTLDEVRPQLEQFLQNQKRQEQTAEFLDLLKNKSTITILI
tara:strand:+ start:2027 stop:3106 length:1080 start_codon:yes stop_codon:yes gene_type:complete